MTFDRISGKRLYMKMENRQKTGAFKIRGATNKVYQLSAQDASKGVIAASAGNHAQGVAVAATKRGIPAKIFMPEGTPAVKAEATRQYGAEAILAGASYQETYEAAVTEQERGGSTFIHAFDDPDVMSGQGTVALEMLQQQPELDTILVPVGGGGLIAGIAVAIKTFRPDIRVIGVQTERASVVYNQYHQNGPSVLSKVDSIADGIAVKKCGELTFPIICQYVDDVVTVSDEEIASAVVLMLEREKTLVEGAGAAALAAGLFRPQYIRGRQCGVVVSGGNADMTSLPRIQKLAQERMKEHLKTG